jgi:hypothetical protein
MTSDIKTDPPVAVVKHGPQLRLIAGDGGKNALQREVMDKTKRPIVRQLQSITIPPWLARIASLASSTDDGAENLAEPRVRAHDRDTSGSPGNRWLLWLCVGALAVVLGLGAALMMRKQTPIGAPAAELRHNPVAVPPRAAAAPAGVSSPERAAAPSGTPAPSTRESTPSVPAKTPGLAPRPLPPRLGKASSRTQRSDTQHSDTSPERAEPPGSAKPNASRLAPFARDPGPSF